MTGGTQNFVISYIMKVTDMFSPALEKVEQKLISISSKYESTINKVEKESNKAKESISKLEKESVKAEATINKMNQTMKTGAEEKVRMTAKEYRAYIEMQQAEKERMRATKEEIKKMKDEEMLAKTELEKTAIHRMTKPLQSWEKNMKYLTTAFRTFAEYRGLHVFNEIRQEALEHATAITRATTAMQGNKQVAKELIEYAEKLSEKEGGNREKIAQTVVQYGRLFNTLGTSDEERINRTKEMIHATQILSVLTGHSAEEISSLIARTNQGGGRILRQLSRLGVPVFETLSESLSKQLGREMSEKELRNLVGKMGQKEILQVVLDLAESKNIQELYLSKLGKFDMAMSRLRNSTKGFKEILGTAVNNALGTFIPELNYASKSLIWLNNVLENNKALSHFVSWIGIGMASMLAFAIAVNGIMFVLDVFTTKLKIATIFTKLFRFAVLTLTWTIRILRTVIAITMAIASVSPVGLITTLVLITALVITLTGKWGAIWTWIKHIGIAIKDFFVSWIDRAIDRIQILLSYIKQLKFLNKLTENKGEALNPAFAMTPQGQNINHLNARNNTKHTSHIDIAIKDTGKNIKNIQAESGGTTTIKNAGTNSLISLKH